MAQLVRYVKSELGQVLETASRRSVFIRVQPAPVNLAERRAVLRALQGYGEVEMFKKLVDNASFVAITSSTAMVTQLLQRSPLSYEFITDKLGAMQPWTSSEITAPIRPIETSARPERPTDRETKHVSQKSFVLSIFGNGDYKHKTVIRHSPLHGPWPTDDDNKESIVYNALKEVVPEGAGSEALCDWHTGGQLSDEDRMLRAQDEHKKASHIDQRLSQKARERKTRSSTIKKMGASSQDDAKQDGQTRAADKPASPQQQSST